MKKFKNIVSSIIQYTVNIAVYILIAYLLIKLGMSADIHSNMFMILISKNAFFFTFLWLFIFGIYLVFLTLWFKEVFKSKGEKSLNQIMQEGVQHEN